jgi:8-oxo-dGTP pyrophosphatase MutT (NUDIX family)
MPKDKNLALITQFAALPWRESGSGLEVLLITSRTNRKWLLPKGWRIEGLSGSETALREAYEEAGLEGSISSTPIGSIRYFKNVSEDELRSAQAVIYPLKVSRELDDWPERAERGRQWFTPFAASEAAYAPSLQYFLRHLARGRIPLAPYR